MNGRGSAEREETMEGADTDVMAGRWRLSEGRHKVEGAITEKRSWMEHAQYTVGGGECM